MSNVNIDAAQGRLLLVAHNKDSDRRVFISVRHHIFATMQPTAPAEALTQPISSLLQWRNVTAAQTSRKMPIMDERADCVVF
jgi:hypothetical protein